MGGHGCHPPEVVSINFVLASSSALIRRYHQLINYSFTHYFLPGRAWKRFINTVPGKWKPELTFQDYPVSSTIYIAMSVNLFDILFQYDAWLLVWSNYFFVKSMRQEPGNNLCGYYVCEFIRQMACHRDAEEAIHHTRVREQYFTINLITINCIEFHSYILISFF